jgi:hypothetical protein
VVSAPLLPTFLLVTKLDRNPKFKKHACCFVDQRGAKIDTALNYFVVFLSEIMLKPYETCISISENILMRRTRKEKWK